MSNKKVKRTRFTEVRRLNKGSKYRCHSYSESDSEEIHGSQTATKRSHLLSKSDSNGIHGSQKAQ